MTFEEARAQLNLILDDLKVEKGETIYMGVDLARIPLPKIQVPLTREAMRGRERDWCAFVLDALLDRLGPNGTLLLPTASNAYGRHGTPYIHEESPAETSAFCEFVRVQPQAIRSLHPLLSVGGIGKNASAILDNVGKAAFGAMSPYGRLAAFDAKFVFLGSGVHALTYGYHLQQVYGVNHMYNKLFNGPVYRGGQPVEGPWLCCLRYLGIGIERDFVPLEERVKREGCVNLSGRSPHSMQSITVADIDRIGYRMLEENPWAFVNGPVEVHISAPGSAPPATRHRAVFYDRVETKEP